MNKQPSDWWRPKFSLKAFLVACLLLGGSVAWFSKHYGQYRFEQRLIEGLHERVHSGTLMTVTTNGETSLLAGNFLM